MSKLDELIKKLCPNGVEYNEISELCKVTRGRVISKEDIKENIGDYPVYSSKTENNGELGKISTYDYNGEYLTWTTDSANAGTVFYRNGKFNITNVCGLLKVTNTKILAKFLYYTLSIEAPKYVNKGMGNPKLMSNVMSKIKIPVPPLEIQNEIVSILDKYTDALFKLKALLKAEFKARKKQYVYYRDMFVNKEKNKYLREVLKIKNGKDYKAFRIGNFPVYGSGGIIAYTSKFSYDKPSVLIPRKGSLNKLYYVEEPFWNVDTIFYTEIDEKIAIPKYVFYCLENEHLEELNIAGAVPSLTQSTLNNIKIFIPDLEEQKKIVDILDKLHYLINSLTEGIPAEIDARQNQYEYYRDKLLTFKELRNK